MDEEKEHAALFWQLIALLDPSQAKHAAEANAKFRLIIAGADHEAVEAAGEGDEPEAPDPAVQKQLTVGNLRR
jgi:uncharacterized protein